MSRLAKQLIGFGAALGITLVVFGFFFLVVWQFDSQLPKSKPAVVTVDIYPSKTKP